MGGGGDFRWRKYQNRYLADCNNYRAITMLLVPGKIFSQIILQRQIDVIEKVFRYQQMGYRMSTN